MEITAFLHNVQSLILALFTLITPPTMGPGLNPGATSQVTTQALTQWAKAQKLAIETQTITSTSDAKRTAIVYTFTMAESKNVDLAAYCFFNGDKLEFVGYMGQVAGSGLVKIKEQLDRIMPGATKHSSGFELSSTIWGLYLHPKMNGLFLLTEINKEPNEHDGEIEYPNAMFMSFLYPMVNGKNPLLAWPEIVDPILSTNPELKKVLK